MVAVLVGAGVVGTGDAAVAIARAIAEALDYVGVLAVEMFEIAGPECSLAQGS
jgi:phosphoribosylaminoimidazole carboxylase (NCAIR synthetase)